MLMLREKKGNRHAIDLLFTLALFCIFAVSLLLVSATGSQVYENIVHQMDNNYTLRTSLSYVTEKLRQNDVSDRVFIEDLNGSTALVLEQNYEDSVFQTWIYEYEGKLRELFLHKGNDVNPEHGQQLMAIEGFSIELVEGNLYKIAITNSGGETEELLINIRSQSGNQ